MAEYIEREKILAVLGSSIYDDECRIPDWDYYKSGVNSGLTSAFYEIKKAPAADVRPERHGAWLDRTDGGEGFVCSNCNGGYTLYDETPFCANCGAKMDEMDGEDNVDL